MLVLSRKQQQQIKIGEQITVTILRVAGNTVRVGIQAPRDVRVVRGELPKRDSSVGESDQAATAENGAVEIGAVEIGTVELVLDRGEAGETLDEVAAEPTTKPTNTEQHPPLVAPASRLRQCDGGNFRSNRGPLAHLVAGSAALAK